MSAKKADWRPWTGLRHAYRETALLELEDAHRQTDLPLRIRSGATLGDQVQVRMPRKGLV